MIKFKQKEYRKCFSLSPRIKSGLTGAKKGALGGLVVSPLLGFGLISEMGIKGKLSTSLAAALLTVPLGAWSGYRSGVEKYDSSLKTVLPTKKRDERRDIEILKNNLLKKFPEISGLCKIYEEVKDYIPDLGDSHPCFYLDFDPDPSKDFIPVLYIDFQWESIGINPSKGWWCTEDKVNKKIDLKTYLIKEFERYSKEYTKSKKNNDLGLEDEDYNNILEFITKVLKSIKKNL